MKQPQRNMEMFGRTNTFTTYGERAIRLVERAVKKGKYENISHAVCCAPRRVVPARWCKRGGGRKGCTGNCRGWKTQSGGATTPFWPADAPLLEKRKRYKKKQEIKNHVAARATMGVTFATICERSIFGKLYFGIRKLYFIYLIRQREPDKETMYQSMYTIKLKTNDSW